MSNRSGPSYEGAHRLAGACAEFGRARLVFICGNKHKFILLQAIAGGQLFASIVADAVDPGDALGGGRAVQKKPPGEQHFAIDGCHFEPIIGNRCDGAGSAVGIDRIAHATVFQRGLLPDTLQRLQVRI